MWLYLHVLEAEVFNGNTQGQGSALALKSDEVRSLSVQGLDGAPETSMVEGTKSI